MAFYLWDSKCKASYLDATRQNFCGFITVDVNGFKKPNTWGKDIYEFAIYSDKILPFYSGMWIEDDCNATSNNGHTCASKYLYGK